MKVPPWIFIVVGWGVLLAAIFVTVEICRKNAPEEVALDNQREAVGGHAH